MVSLNEILASVEPTSIIEVARSVVGDPSIVDAGLIKAEPVGAVHNDQRTLAILRVTGNASTPTSPALAPWSAILKVMDPTIPTNDAAIWVSPELEEMVYRRGLFRNPNIPFRAARCYLSRQTPTGQFQIWLEDLTDATQPPWSADLYASTVYNLGRFNGHYAGVGELPAGLNINRNNFANRWKSLELVGSLNELAGYASSEIVRKVFAPGQIAAVVDTANYVDRFIARASSLQTALAHGDSHARNLFPMNDHVVAVDWSGISEEPLGADAGVLIGSGLTWGINEAEMVLDNIENYSRYLDGLHDAGWAGDILALRVGFFAQFGIYLTLISTFTVALLNGKAEERRGFYEARLEATLEEVPDRFALISSILVKYLTEFKSLAVG